jgi:hypothetical protein
MMKKLLALILVALLSSAAFGQPTLGLFFSDTTFDDSTTNFNAIANVPFDSYIVMLGGEDFTAVGVYEVGITLPASVFTLNVEGPNGWTNFGGNTNHLVGFGANDLGFPIPGANGAVVLCTMQLMATTTDALVIEFGPADPPSVPDWDGPVVADSDDVNTLIPAPTTAGEMNGVVATLNGAGITAVESETFSDVKDLFR